MATNRARSLRFVDEIEVGSQRATPSSGPWAPTTPTSSFCGPYLGSARSWPYTIASEIGDIARFSSPKKLAGYTGLCPIVRQSGGRDGRGPLARNGAKDLRWALIGAATRAARHAAERERYERTKERLCSLDGMLRGPS